jgi:predicted MFS family arabinose efflux permease
MGRLQVIAVLGTAQTLAWGSTYYLPAILANNMAAALGVGTPTVFIAFSCGILLSAFLGPGSGRLIDTFGGRRVLGATSVIFAAGLALLGSATSTASLFLAWLVIGAGMSAGLYEAAFATLARIYGADARRSITGITLIAGFASTVCWPLSAWMDASLGWRTTCHVWAVAHLLVGLPLNLLLPSTRVQHHVEGKDSQTPRQRRWGVMAGLAFVFASAWFCSTAMAAHVPRLLQEAGASLPAAIAAAALIGPAQVAARVLEFSLVRHMHPLTSARIATLAHPVGALGLNLAGAPAAPFFTVTHGGGNGVMTIAIGTLPLALFGPAGYGLRQGLLTAPARLAQASAPFVFDLLLSAYGVASLAFTSGLMAASFVVLMLIPGRSRS